MSIAPPLETEVPAPDIWWSNQATNRPDYQKLNVPDHALVSNEVITEPHSYTEAISRPDTLIWEKAMQMEINQHWEISTWELVHLPPDQNAIGCQWVYAIKTKLNGEFEKLRRGITAVAYMLAMLGEGPMMASHWFVSSVLKSCAIKGQ